MNSVHGHFLFLLRFILIFFHLHLHLPSDVFTSFFPSSSFCVFFFSYIRATCPTYLNHDLITRSYLVTCLNHEALHYAYAASIRRLLPPVRTKYFAEHLLFEHPRPCKPTDKTVSLCVLIFVRFDSKREAERFCT